MTHLETQVRHWYQGATEAWITAQWLRKGKRNAECLFFCQLTLEKLLKGLVVLTTNKPAPYLHDLVRLAVLAALEYSDARREDLTMITGFNLQARYDDEREAFHKLATASFTDQYIERTDTLRVWLQKKYPPEYVSS